MQIELIRTINVIKVHLKIVDGVYQREEATDEEGNILSVTWSHVYNDSSIRRLPYNDLENLGLEKKYKQLIRNQHIEDIIGEKNS